MQNSCYYGIKNDWPGLSDAQQESVPTEIASVINAATHAKVNETLSEFRSQERFIPYTAVHEFETLLFSDPIIASEVLGIPPDNIKAVLDQFRDPELINNSPETAPSKRLMSLYSRYKKTSTGIKIAEAIGIEKMRAECRVFNDWLNPLESLVS